MTNETTFRHGLMGSSFVVALIGVVCVDMWFAAANPLTTAPIANLQRTEPFYAAQEYRRQCQQLAAAPDVVLLGSSVMVSPVLQAESLRLQSPLKRMRHRQCGELAQALNAEGLRVHRVFNFAVFGCMVSDAYWITKNVLLPGRCQKPRAIIYGVAPRDIQDNILQLSGIPATESFQCLASADDALCVKNTMEMNWTKRLELVFGRVSSLWRCRADLVALANLRGKKLLEAALPWVAFENRLSDGSVKVQRGGMFREEAIGEPMVVPGYGLEHISTELTDQQYQFRYNPLSPRMNEVQLSYLEKLIALCREQEVTLVIVNMPLSEHNHKLMPPALYPLFVDRVASACRHGQVEFVDLAKTGCYTGDDNFVDGVHLSCERSRPFLKFLATQLSATKLSSALHSQVATTGSAK
jgi:hypothetical protein